jgi:hypothetical protein
MSTNSFKVVWIASAQRTGSSWAYHVAKSILVAGGYKLVGPGRGVEPRAVPGFARAVIQQDRPGVAACLKTHLPLKLDIPRTRYIVTYRDVRDSMLSWMRVTGGNFIQGLQSAQEMMALTDHYLQAPDDVGLKLRYDEITVTPALAVQRIAQFLAVPFAPDAVARMVEELDRDRIASRLARFEETVRQKLAAGESLPEWAVLKGPNGKTRYIDWEHGFQTGHVTSQRDGEWRDVLAPEEQARLLALTRDWLRRHGFAVEG